MHNNWLLFVLQGLMHAVNLPICQLGITEFTVLTWYRNNQREEPIRKCCQNGAHVAVNVNKSILRAKWKAEKDYKFVASLTHILDLFVLLCDRTFKDSRLVTIALCLFIF